MLCLKHQKITDFDFSGNLFPSPHPRPPSDHFSMDGGLPAVPKILISITYIEQGTTEVEKRNWVSFGPQFNAMSMATNF